MEIHKACPEDINPSFLSALFTNFSDYYLKNQQYDEAQLLLEKSLELDKNAPEKNHIYLAIDYLNLGWASQSTNLKKSLNYFHLAREHFELGNIDDYHPDIISYLTLFIQTAEINLLLNNAQEALQDINTFFVKEKEFQYNNNLLFVRAIVKKGNIYQHLGQYEYALEQYANAYRRYQKVTGPQQIIGIHELLIKTAECYLATNEPAKSLELIDRSFTLIDQSGTPDQCRIDKMLVPSLLFELYTLQARALKQQYLKTGESTILKDAQTAYLYALEIFEHIKISVGNRESRRIFLNNNYSFFENAVDLNFFLWEETKDSTALENIFFLTEKSKNNLLAEGLNEDNYAITGGLPDSLLKTIRQLDIKITKVKNIYLDKENHTDESLMSSTRSTLLDLQQKKSLHLSFIEKNHPEYYQIKYQVTVPAVEDIQNTLSDQEGVVSYFVSDDYLYVSLIDQQNFSVERIPLDFPLTGLVNQYREAIINSSGVQHKVTKEELIAYQQVAHLLYQKILAPFVRKIPPRITILPDHQLGNLAFDALLTHLPDTNTSLRDYPYLMNDYIISYQYSASSLLKKNRSIAPAPKGFLAFAPKFEGNKSFSVAQLRDFGGLFYNDLEVDQIHKIMGGTIIKNQLATEEKFIELAPNYQVIHLATHGKVNLEDADFSYLAFQEIEDAIENELLYVRDIYNLKLKADLVVLSACETASGTFNHGEGIISLSRGFIYSGAAAVLPTLWKISDATTATIMEDFYKELKDARPKDIALATAKKNFLRETDIATAHPFFWAAFTMIGDSSPIIPVVEKSNDFFIKLYWMIFMIPIFMLIGWLWSRRKNSP